MKKAFLLLTALTGFLWNIRTQSLFLLGVLAILLNACLPESPGKLEITVTHEKFQNRIDMIIKGKNFSPSKPVTLTLINFPKVDGNIIGNTTADASGSFTYRREFAYRTVDRNEEFINILVIARDEATSKVVIEQVSPYPYIIIR